MQSTRKTKPEPAQQADLPVDVLTLFITGKTLSAQMIETTRNLRDKKNLLKKMKDQGITTGLDAARSQVASLRDSLYDQYLQLQALQLQVNAWFEKEYQL